jgi:protein tyrosine phosphatase (PTP) superfamily phosphohydrolase (DUF442 family)
VSDRIEDIVNFWSISDRLATAGQPTMAQYPAIVGAGYRVVINLALTDSPDALPSEAAIARDLGLEYIHIPVIWDAPKLTDFQEFVTVMMARRDRHIFIHCAANKRVSAFVYLCRLLYEGIDEATARRDLTQIWTPNDIWQNFIDMVTDVNLDPT